MSYDKFNELTDSELTSHVASMENPTDLELELMQRLDLRIEETEELLDVMQAEPEHEHA